MSGEQEIVRDHSEDVLIRAIENNASEFLMEMGRVGGGEIRDEAGVQWVIGGSPLDYHNAVVRANLKPEEIGGVVEESIACMRKYRVPGTWHVGPSMQPGDIGEHLRAHGFQSEGADIGMAANLLKLPDHVVMPQECRIERVHTDEQLEIWGRTLGKEFGEGELEGNWVWDVYRKIGLQDDRWRHYLGWLDGEPVATTTMFLGAGVAGIYFVLTLSQARKKGIGAAMTLMPLLEARSLGYEIGVLGASQMGYPVYKRIGFQKYCLIEIYAWKPKEG